MKEIQGYRTLGVSLKKLLDTGFKYKYGLDEMFDDGAKKGSSFASPFLAELSS